LSVIFLTVFTVVPTYSQGVLFLSCANLATSDIPPNTPATIPAAFPIVSNESIRPLFPSTLPIALPTVSNFLPVVLQIVARFLLSTTF
jgi:hypothetical protein